MLVARAGSSLRPVELVTRYSKPGHPWDQLRRLQAKLPAQASERGQRAKSDVSRPHKLERWLTPELVEQVVRDYQAGISSSQLTLNYQLGKSSVLRILHDAGVRMRKQGFDPVHLEAAATAYRAGESLATIARRYDCGPDNLRRALVAHGVMIRRRRGWDYGSSTVPADA